MAFKRKGSIDTETIAMVPKSSMMTKAMDTAKRNLLRGFIPQIKDNLKNIDPFLKEKLLMVPLESGETHAGYLLVAGNDGTAHMLTVSFDKDDQLKRIVDDITVIDFIGNLLTII